MTIVRKILAFFVFLACVQSAQAADWTKQKSNTLAWLRDVYFLDEQTGWTAGSGGVFLKTVDGGRTWTRAKTFTDDAILQIYFTDASNGWLLCERNLYALGTNSPSYLLRTVDGGGNWERIEFAENGRRRITKFLFAPSGAGLAFGEGNQFFTTTANDEKIWKRQPSPVRYLMLDGVFTDDAHGVIVGAGGSILLTDDAGATWDKGTIFGSADARLNAVFFANRKIGWAVGINGKIFQTVNGGRVWREQKSTVAADLTDIFFTSTSDGWAIGDAGAMLHTTTAGNVWKAVDAKIKHRLERIYFVGRRGWAVGFGGTILSYDENGGDENSAVLPPKLLVRN